MKIEGTSSNESSAGQVPDPRVDFAAWAEFREQQVFWDYESRWRANPQDPGLLDHFADQMQRCHEEITDTAAELGIPVAPAGPDDEEIMRRSLALNLAVRTTPVPVNTTIEDVLRIVANRADQILAGSVPVDAVEAIARAEESARNELAALVERHSRGDQSQVELAGRIRANRFGLTARQDAARTQLPASRPARRSKPRRREHGRRARSGGSRGDPSRSDDDPAPSAPRSPFLSGCSR